MKWTPLAVALIACPVAARTLTVDGGPQALAKSLARARDGDVVEVRGGPYRGPLKVDRALVLRGIGYPVIDGGGAGTVVELASAGASLQGFQIRGSGDVLDEENSAVAVTAPDCVVADNHIVDALFGIYLRRATRTRVVGNDITSKSLPVPERGDGIRVWFSTDVTVADNDVRLARDVVLWYSERLTVRDNRVHEGRYGLHFMYCDDAVIERNRLHDNSVGAFLMYSRRLRLRHNLIAHNRGPSGYGVGLKDMDDHEIVDNIFYDNRVGAYIDNSPRELQGYGLFQGNAFAFNDIGVSLLPLVRRNRFTGNSFVDNLEQVAVTGGGRLHGNQWSVGGRGNYWSDYAGMDGDGDGRGDAPYRAEKLFEHLSDRRPATRLFVFSPATQALEFAARAAPLVRPQPKLVDEHPLMQPRRPKTPALPAAPAGSAARTSLALLMLGLVLSVTPAVAWRRRAAAWTEHRR